MKYRSDFGYVSMMLTFPDEKPRDNVKEFLKDHGITKATSVEAVMCPIEDTFEDSLSRFVETYEDIYNLRILDMFLHATQIGCKSGYRCVFFHFEWEVRS